MKVWRRRSFFRLGLLLLPAAFWVGFAGSSALAVEIGSFDLFPEVTATAQHDQLALASDDQNRVFAVFRVVDFSGPSGDDGDIFFTRSLDSGQTWSTPAPVSADFDSDDLRESHPEIATDGAGNLVIVWEGEVQPNDSDIYVASSTDAGVSFTTPVTLNHYAATDTGDDSDPVIATDTQGEWLAAWVSTEPFVSSGSPGSEPLAEGKASPQGSESSAQDTSPSPRGAPPADIGTDQDIIFSRSFDGGVTWALAVPLNDYAGEDDALDEEVTIAADPDGEWGAVWTTNHPDITFDPDGIERDLAYSWAPSLNPPIDFWDEAAHFNLTAPTDSFDDYSPHLGTDGDDTWVTVWISEEDINGAGNDGDVVASQSTDGGMTWISPVPSVDAASENFFDLSPSVDFGTDGWFVTSTESSPPGSVVLHPWDPMAMSFGAQEVVTTGAFGRLTIGSGFLFIGAQLGLDVGLARGAANLTPDVSLSTTSMQFGRQDVTAGQSVSQLVIIRNTGTADLTITRVDSLDPQFVIVSDTGETMLGPGEGRAVRIAFDPGEQGPISTFLVVDSNSPGEESLDVALNGTGVLGPEIALNPEELTFDAVPIGAPVSLPIEIQSAGSRVLVIERPFLETISGTGETSGDFSLDFFRHSILQIPPGFSESQTVRFRPSRPGIQTAFYTVPNNDPDESPARALVTGQGVGNDFLPLAIALDFGRVPVRPSITQLLISRAIVVRRLNTRPSDIPLLSLRVIGEAAEAFNAFASGGAFGTAPGNKSGGGSAAQGDGVRTIAGIEPDEEIELTVQYEPEEMGEHVAYLEISVSFTSSETGIAPMGEVEPDEVHVIPLFGSVVDPETGGQASSAGPAWTDYR